MTYLVTRNLSVRFIQKKNQRLHDQGDRDGTFICSQCRLLACAAEMGEVAACQEIPTYFQLSRVLYWSVFLLCLSTSAQW